MNRSQLVRAAASFCIVLCAYGVYSFAFVPFVEPAAESHDVDERSIVGDGPRKGNQNRLKQFGRYFPPGAWELENAKVLESEQATLFIREYKNLPDGRVELHPFTMLFLPRDRPADAAPDGKEARAIVLEAPQGAILQFDERFDLKRAKLGKLIGGNLMGPIHIQNAPPCPGAADELDIRTRDVVLIGDKIVTPNVVNFRFGPNSGTGRDMVILLGQKDDPTGGGSQGLAFNGMRALTLKYDVKMRVQLGGKGLMPGSTQKPPEPAPKVAAKPTKPTKPGDPPTKPGDPPTKPGDPPTKLGDSATKPGDPPAKNDPPVEVTCQGPFKFDVARNVATFTDQVNVLQLNPVGPGDTMRCEMLAIYFVERQPAPPPPGKTPVQPPAPAPIKAPEKPRESADAAQLSKLEPRLIEARGEPVIVHSPSKGGHARCQRLEYDMANAVIRLEDSNEVLLNQGPSEIRCKRLDYQPPKIGRLGRLTAIGPGTLQGFPEGDPIHKYQARWTNRLTMQPEGPLSLVTLLGDAQMRLTDTGALSAEEIYIWVSEVQPPDGAPPAAKPPAAAKPSTDPLGNQADAAGIQVERLMAKQRVRIDSTQLSGATNKLEVWINRPVAVAPSPVAGVPAPAATAANPAPAPAPAPAKQASRPANPSQRFDVSGGALRMQVAANGPTMVVSDVDVDENARFTETKTAKPGEQPLFVRGQNLHVSGADTPNAHVIVSGKPGYVEARGMTLTGAIINMQRGANRLWIDGPGRMTLPTQGQLASPRSQPRSATPKPPAKPRDPRAQSANQPLEITWQGSMHFDGLLATFDRSVLARAEHQNLRTELMHVTLKQRIDFNAPPPEPGASGGGASEVDVVDCRGDVRLAARAFDDKGLLESIDDMQLETLSINQTTGVIGGLGPGWVNSVRRGDSAGPSPGGNPGASPAKATAGEKPKSTSNEKFKPVADSRPKPAPRETMGNRTGRPNAGGPNSGGQNNGVPGADGPEEPENRLSYLHVTFEKNLTGNIHRRELTFADHVRATFAPVDDWQHKIDPDNFESLGPSGIDLHCDQLTVRETPAARPTERGTTEMEAIGGTLVEGQSFTARAHRLTYAQAKDLLVFEGNGRNDAEMYRQLKPGSPATKATARKIMYWRGSNRAEVDDGRFIDMSIPGGSNTPAFKDPLTPKKK